MKKALLRSAVATAVLAGATVSAAPAANAGSCVGSMCGTVVNQTSLGMRVAMGWCSEDDRYEPLGSSCPSGIRGLSPHSSTDGWGDVDAYEIPYRCTFWVDIKNFWGWEGTKVQGAGWYKIDTDDVAYIRNYECRGV
ncbi:hypothetical protein ACFCV3_12775 [Kribbella sp. NPDC056345]|uniref:hypothetical protein n=1 Tax=Kribbella sp. NPDC056345 TaxID=3345789 RepID=UPI0035D58F54